MSRRLLPLIPAGLSVAQVLPAPDRVTVPMPPQNACPLCGSFSGRVHSHYTRTLADLPWQGCVVAIQVRARRFRCATAGCPRRIFTERLPEVALPRARRTVRMSSIQRTSALHSAATRRRKQPRSGARQRGRRPRAGAAPGC